VAVDEFIISGSKSLNFLFSYFIYLKLIHSSIHQPHLLVLKQAFLRKPQKKKKKKFDYHQRIFGGERHPTGLRD
jgi:hypothetical protein